MFRVMLVEDDTKLAALITEYLNGYEFTVHGISRGDAVLEEFQRIAPDIVVLDLMLPGLDGMVVCRRIRELYNVPILILTAREDTFDEVSCLEQGADDYVNKPVQPRVLLARLRALGRRMQSNVGACSEDIVIGALRISRQNRTVAWRSAPVTLNTSEYKLLLMLVESAGHVLSRNGILKKMRGLEFNGLDRSIDNCISRLRRKFDDTQAEKIKTVWGEGYLLSPSAWK